MIKSENMMSIDDIKDILGIPLIGVVPDSEQVIIASNRGEPLVLDETLSAPGIAFEQTARRLQGEDIKFLDLSIVNAKNPVRRLFQTLKNQYNND